MPMARYAELQVTTNFSFLTGGSHPQELVAQAKALGLTALAIADRNTLAGVVRAHAAARELGLRLIVGARLDLEDAPSLICLPTDRQAYGRLCRLLSLGQGRAGKGACSLRLADLAAHAEGQILIALAPADWSWRKAAGPGRDQEGKPGAAILRLPVRSSSAAPALPSSSLAGSDRGTGGHAEHDVSPSPLLQAPKPCFESDLQRLGQALGSARLYLAASHAYRGDDRARIAALADLARRCRIPLVATGDVLYHAPHRRPLQDVLTCIRHGVTIREAGHRLAANAERHLKPPAAMARLFRGFEDALARTIEIADLCRFSLDELVYEYPEEPVPPGTTAQSHLETLAWEGARWRFPDGIPENVGATITRELALIATLGYAPYFLTVHDIVQFARSRGILAQGRGSAANSVVCYCLAITAVNPVEVDLLFERFVSEARREPPDIDVDFEHERREEVIQYIYARYGRDRAGLAATVISYRARSAVREVGKAMGLSGDTVAALAGMVWGSHASSRGGGGALPEAHVREAGLDPGDPLLATVLELADELIGFPRHLSQHVGGLVLTRGPLVEVVPVGNAAMADRTFIEWDKDDLGTLGLLKVDVLALGMLSCIRRAFDLLALHHGRPMTLAEVPREDPAVYDMLCRADSVGVFQVESRAQMNMLPRLKPRTFYDLVIEVAIVRPGPIQGDMVHPYLRRRSGAEPEDYPSPAPEHGDRDELRQILAKTKGVPLFQEQAMRIAMVAAKFTDAEVNELRKAMATFRRRGTIGLLEKKMVSRMVARGYSRTFAERCFNQIKGFGEYGFPESHAASFAHLVYVSSWLKCHYPAAFAAAILNSQPMGFYAPAQLVRDAREHGVAVAGVDVNHSDWDCTLEEVSGDEGQKAGDRGLGAGRQIALRLGLRQIDGLRQEEAERMVAARKRGQETSDGKQGMRRSAFSLPPPSVTWNLFPSLHDLWLRTGVGLATLERLAAADAFRSMGLDRRQALWEVKALTAAEPLPLFAWGHARDAGPEAAVTLPAMALSEHVVNDYQTLRLSLKAHPMSFLRSRLAGERVAACADVRSAKGGAWVKVAGVILVRQRPGSAKGVVFMTIEDETGIANAVVWPKTLERFRKIVMTARLIEIEGRIQRHEDIVHVVSVRLVDRSDLLLGLSEWAGRLEIPVANADEVVRPEPGSARSADRQPSRDAAQRRASHATTALPAGRHPRDVRIIAKPEMAATRPRAILPPSRDFH